MGSLSLQDTWHHSHWSAVGAGGLQYTLRKLEVLLLIDGVIALGDGGGGVGGVNIEGVGDHSLQFQQGHSNMSLSHIMVKCELIQFLLSYQRRCSQVRIQDYPLLHSVPFVSPGL